MTVKVCCQRPAPTHRSSALHSYAEFNLRRRVYELYTDYVLKNPFYEMEMPIRCELFDTNLIGTILNMNRRWGVVVQPAANS